VDLVDALVAYERVQVLQRRGRPADAGLVQVVLQVSRGCLPEDSFRPNTEDLRVTDLVDPDR